MPNRVSASVSRAACASFAVALVFALLSACGSGPKHPVPTYHGDPPAPPGATSPEELVYFSTVVARVRLLSSSAGVRNYPPDDDRDPAPAFAFRFRVVEYLKGSGDDELTVRVLATGRRDYIIAPNSNAALALMMAQSRLAERDTRWDDREAVAFLRPSPNSAESGAYEFTYRGDWSPALNDYAVTSDYDNSYVPNRAWLPAVASSGDAAGKGASAPEEPRYLASAPAAQPAQTAGGVPDDYASPSATSISLSEMKALVAADEEMATKGKDVPGYGDCLKDKYEFDARYRRYPPEMDFIERRIHSGQPAGYRLLPNPSGVRHGAYYGKWWFAGPDSDLFAIRITNDPDNDPSTGYAWEEVALRPIPEGEYKVFLNDQPPTWAPCGYYPEAALNKREATIIATAPDGVVHEAFFDPADMKGGAVGANGSNGVLKPTDFTFNGASVSLDSIRWDSQAVEMRLSPHTRLANHRADFIAPDGSVSLRLDFDDAEETGEGASRALRWEVDNQPWSDGDLLMLRLSESPADPAGAN